MTNRFPKKLVLVAVVLELLILTLTLSHPTKLFSSLSAEPQPRVNFMSIAPALPNASVSRMQPVHRAPGAMSLKAPGKRYTEGPTVVLDKPPQPVI